MSTRNRKGGLPPDDMDLWLHATRDIQPLGRRRVHVEPVQESRARLPGPSRTPAPARPAAAVPGQTHVRGSPPPPPLVHGSTAGLDGRKAERLRRGRLPIKATLDLHGMTQAQAHPALNRFIERMAATDRRCVLIITGKGGGKGPDTFGAQEGGVLRRQVPAWLNQSPNREKVVSFDYAQPKHGGTGALYVLLKRRRS